MLSYGIGLKTSNGADFDLFDRMIRGFYPDDIRHIGNNILEKIEKELENTRSDGILKVLKEGIGKDTMYTFYADEAMANSDEPRKASEGPATALEKILTRTFVIKMFLKRTSSINLRNYKFNDSWWTANPTTALKHEYQGYKSLIEVGDGSSVDGTNFWSSYKDSLLGIFFNS